MALCILKFSSDEKAREAFSGITADWKGLEMRPLSMGNEALDIYSEFDGVDGSFFRAADFLALALLGGEGRIDRGGSLRYAACLMDSL